MNSVPICVNIIGNILKCNYGMLCTNCGSMASVGQCLHIYTALLLLLLLLLTSGSGNNVCKYYWKKHIKFSIKAMYSFEILDYDPDKRIFVSSHLK